MALNTSAHQVTKVTIASERQITGSSASRDFTTRDIVIEFADGTSQTIELYSAASVENIIVEIK
jgi:hypothetical protein